MGEVQKQQHQLREMLEGYWYDQSQRPKKGDVVSYFDTDFNDWMQVMVIGTQKPSSVHKDYFNIKFLDIDRDDDGVFLYPGSYWTFGLPVDKDQALDEAGPDPEGVRQALVVPPSRDISEISTHQRRESDLNDDGDQILRHESDWKSGGVLQLNPGESLVHGMVYSLPESLSVDPPPEESSETLFTTRARTHEDKHS